MMEIVIKRLPKAIIHIVGNTIDLSKMPLINSKHEEEKERYRISFLFNNEASMIVDKDGMTWLRQDPSNFIVATYSLNGKEKVFGSWNNYGD